VTPLYTNLLFLLLYEVHQNSEVLVMPPGSCGPKESSVIKWSRFRKKRGSFMWGGFLLDQIRPSAKVGAITNANLRRRCDLSPSYF